MKTTGINALLFLQKNDRRCNLRPVLAYCNLLVKRAFLLEFRS